MFNDGHLGAKLTSAPQQQFKVVLSTAVPHLHVVFFSFLEYGNYKLRLEIEYIIIIATSGQKWEL